MSSSRRPYIVVLIEYYRDVRCEICLVLLYRAGLSPANFPRNFGAVSDRKSFEITQVDILRGLSNLFPIRRIAREWRRCDTIRGARTTMNDLAAPPKVRNIRSTSP